MPTAHITMKVASSLGFTALRSIIIDGNDNVVTAIINDNTVPSCAPLNSNASATGIAITAKKFRAEFPDSMLNQYPEEAINSKTVFECAEKGDPTAIEVFRYTGQKLGEALANFVMFSSPEAILLFGGVIKAGDFLLKPAKLHMERNLLPIFRSKVKLVFSELDEADAAILGASALVWENK